MVIDYGLTDNANISNILEYLMKKHKIKSFSN